MLPSDAEDSHLYGISFYKSILGGCVKRYFCERDADADGSDDATFGTDVHAWLAAYHDNRPLPELSEEIPPGAYVSPAELMRRYAKRFSPGGLGQGLLTEKRLEMAFQWRDSLIPIPVVGTIDRISRFDEMDCELLFNERGVQLTPGDYLIDHKSKRARSATMIQSFLLEPQFTNYHKLAEANGFGPLAGTLVNIMIRYKEDRDDSFVTLLVPPPDEEAEKVWRHIIVEGSAKLREKGRDWVDPTDCFSYSRACGCLGECARHNL